MIKISNLRKSFGKVLVLDGVDLEIGKGEVVCLCGPSGSGKSTLLRCINGLETPESGSIVVDRTEVTDAATDMNVVRRRLGMVFQHFNLFPHKTAMQNVTLAPAKLGLAGHDDAQAMAMELLRKVGLADKAHVYPRHLSGGQKQRVAIARALALDPEAMLFDEPTSALDPEMVSEVLSVMKLLASDGMTMIIVTHEMGFARSAANSICFLDGGRILERNTPAELLDHPQHERTRQFLSKVL